MSGTDVGTRAEESASRFIESLGVDVRPHDAAIMFNAYVVGWIQGVYAGANEARLDVCKRRTRRTTCNHSEKG